MVFVPCNIPHNRCRFASAVADRFKYADRMETAPAFAALRPDRLPPTFFLGANEPQIGPSIMAGGAGRGNYFMGLAPPTCVRPAPKQDHCLLFGRSPVRSPFPSKDDILPPGRPLPYSAY